MGGHVDIVRVERDRRNAGAVQAKGLRLLARIHRVDHTRLQSSHFLEWRSEHNVVYNYVL